MNKFAFLVHPRLSAREDMGRVSPFFKLFPEKFLQFIIKFLPPIAGGNISIKNNSDVAGFIIVIPLVGSQFYSLPRKKVLSKLKSAIKKAKKLGVSVVGLGEFTSSISHGGLDLINDARVAITNGNSLTAGITCKSIKKIIDDYAFDKNNLVIGVIGAAGSVGGAVTQMLAEDGFSILANDKNIDRLFKLKTKIDQSVKQNRVKIINSLDKLIDADIVVVASSATELIVRADYLKKNAIVYDITQPRNLSLSLVKERPDVIIIDGGIVNTPAIDYGMDIGLLPHQTFACLAETMIYALEGKKNNSVGFTNSNKAREMLSLMNGYPYFDTKFYSFGKPLE